MSEETEEEPDRYEAATTHVDIDAWLPATQLLPVLKSESGHGIPLRDLLKIDPQNLIMDFQIHPNWQATIAWQTTRQEVRTQRAKRDLGRAEALVFQEHRARLMGASARSPGVDLVNSYVVLDPRVIAAQDQLFAEEEKLGAWKAATGAMYARRECLINMGAEVRLERKSGA